METREEKFSIPTEKITLGFIEFMHVCSLMDSYALENIAFGKLRQGDKIPFDKFVNDLELQALNPYAYKDRIEGLAISEKLTVNDEDTELFFKELFADEMNTVFETAPKKGCDYDDDGLYYFKYALSEYIWKLYPLYIEILKTEVEAELSDTADRSFDRASETACYERIAKFIVAIKTKGLRQGGCVNRYVKDLPHIPHFVNKLLKVQKNRYLLANSDTESIDYKLAVLSSIKFMTPTHTRLFELKAKKWAESRLNK